MTIVDVKYVISEQQGISEAAIKANGDIVKLGKSQQRFTRPMFVLVLSPTQRTTTTGCYLEAHEEGLVFRVKHLEMITRSRFLWMYFDSPHHTPALCETFRLSRAVY